VDRILWVDMTAGRVEVEVLPELYRRLGGRALTSRLVKDVVPAEADPLGPENLLVFAAGLLGGTTASSANRISAGGVSPLTGGIKESNAGGNTALYLAGSGIRAIAVKGRSAGLRYLYVEGEKAELRDAADLAGLEVGEATRRLMSVHGEDVGVIVIGPAGEMGLRAAGIANTDMDGVPGRYCGRGGLGAVMGVKGLKAVVISRRGFEYRAPADPALWKEANRRYVDLLRENPVTGKSMPKYGTAATLELVNELGGLPTRNFSSGSFEDADRISGRAMYEIITERGGEGTPTHACMPGCVVRCSNRYADPEGKLFVSPMEYETNTLMGSNLGIADFDVIAELNRLCNELGLDTIEVGAALGVAMEAGVLEFGDGRGAVRAVQEIGEGTVLGRVLGNGAAVTGTVFGVQRVPVVKGQALAAYDPRAIKGNGVTYVTSPMGADHTAGNTIVVKTDHLDPSDKVEISRTLQIKTAVLDSLGLCAFVRAVFFDRPEVVADMMTALWGERWTAEDLMALGRETIRTELEVNRARGFGPQDDRLPAYFLTEALPPRDAVWDVPLEEIEKFWRDL